VSRRVRNRPWNEDGCRAARLAARARCGTAGTLRRHRSRGRRTAPGRRVRSRGCGRPRLTAPAGAARRRVLRLPSARRGPRQTSACSRRRAPPASRTAGVPGPRRSSRRNRASRRRRSPMGWRRTGAALAPGLRPPAERLRPSLARVDQGHPRLHGQRVEAAPAVLADGRRPPCPRRPRSRAGQRPQRQPRRRRRPSRHGGRRLRTHTARLAPRSQPPQRPRPSPRRRGARPRRRTDRCRRGRSGSREQRRALQCRRLRGQRSPRGRPP
jgi:hypothetical protein